MADSNTAERHDGRVRQPVPTSGKLLSFDLEQEVRRLKAEQPWQAEHTANTIVKFPDLRVVLIALKKGAHLREHKTAARITVHCLSGQIQVEAAAQTVDMSEGSLLSLDENVAHSVTAKSDSVFLVTMAWHEQPSA